MISSDRPGRISGNFAAVVMRALGYGGRRSAGECRHAPKAPRFLARLPEIRPAIRIDHFPHAGLQLHRPDRRVMMIDTTRPAPPADPLDNCGILDADGLRMFIVIWHWKMNVISRVETSIYLFNRHRVLFNDHNSKSRHIEIGSADTRVLMKITLTPRRLCMKADYDDGE